MAAAMALLAAVISWPLSRASMKASGTVMAGLKMACAMSCASMLVVVLLVSLMGSFGGWVVVGVGAAAWLVRHQPTVGSPLRSRNAIWLGGASDSTPNLPTCSAVLRVTSSPALPSMVGRLNLQVCLHSTWCVPGIFSNENFTVTSPVFSLSITPAATWLSAAESMRSNWPPSRSVMNSPTSVVDAVVDALVGAWDMVKISCGRVGETIKLIATSACPSSANGRFDQKNHPGHAHQQHQGDARQFGAGGWGVCQVVAQRAEGLGQLAGGGSRAGRAALLALVGAANAV